MDCTYIVVPKMVLRVSTLGYPCCLQSLDYKKEPMENSGGSKEKVKVTWLHERLKDE